MADRTTVTLRGDTKSMLADAKPDGVSWDHFMMTLLNCYDEEGQGFVKLSDEQYQNLIDDVAAAVERRFEQSIRELSRGNSF
jgi:hypothetical protein